MPPRIPDWKKQERHWNLNKSCFPMESNLAVISLIWMALQNTVDQLHPRLRVVEEARDLLKAALMLEEA